MNLLSTKNILHTLLLGITLSAAVPLIAATDEYNSELVNKTNQNKSKGYKLIKTRMWPNANCLLDTGKDVVNPGDSAALRIKKDTQCSQAGVGYEIYRADDTKKEHLLGYLSHRFAEEKFSVQISRFCKGGKCVFMDLNPEQDR